VWCSLRRCIAAPSVEIPCEQFSSALMATMARTLRHRPEPLRTCPTLAFMAYSLASWDAAMARSNYSDTEKFNFKVSSSELPSATSYLTSVSFSRSTSTLFRDRNSSIQLADDYSSAQVLQAYYVQDGLQAELGGGINPSKSAGPCKFLY
jgi:hypothetical protein